MIFKPYKYYYTELLEALSNNEKLLEDGRISEDERNKYLKVIVEKYRFERISEKYEDEHRKFEVCLFGALLVFFITVIAIIYV
ncbi:hypothetical protein [Macrococcus sp. DPC7161]|uniref:hypothetical protein n=1 Tax=Macrococcus sp. DPC7161 TaxID=2507060 RepID=UPI00100C1F58|nr:hypothetical protein [Macrococcus sp. DPC7161]RXK19075.1 hypothetical protein ER639_01815 [Macrococcus sp. DPC7161]